MRKRSNCTVIVLLTALLTPPVLADEEQIMSRGSITFVSGGVGEDSAERMAALSKDFNLKLLFATKDGHYLADVSVTISDSRGATVLETVSAGPFLLAKLVPGKYQIKATYAGASFAQQTTIPAGARREMVFRWVEADV